MKINLNEVNREEFLVHENNVYGEPLYLIQPQHIGCKWTQENKIFRSSMWNAQGELVSAGFPKFVNWGENPEQFPIPKSLKGCVCTEKLDGSLLIFSKYKGQYILRTRGTADASVHDNGAELEEFKKRFLTANPYFTRGNLSTWDVSYLFEWVSPKQRIILNYGDEPDWFLVGIVDHGDYSLLPQKMLDEQAELMFCKRPKIYDFDSLEDLLKIVEEWRGKEGIVLYSNGDQTLHKIKSAWYLALHRMKSEIANVENLTDVYLTWGMPDYQEFEKKIIETFDFELFSQIRGDVSKICEAKKEAIKIVDHIKNKVPEWKTMSRKDAALDIISSYGQTMKKSIAFAVLDGREPDQKAWKTLILQSL